MSDAWFHKRRPEEGTGYGIRSRSGLIATIVFILLITAIVIAAVNAPAYLHTPPLTTLLVTMGLIVVLIFAFVGLVIVRSDGPHNK